MERNGAEPAPTLICPSPRLQGEVGREWPLTLRSRATPPQPSPACKGGSTARSEPAAIFARALNIADAATAQLRVFRMAAHVVATMPAAYAFEGAADAGGHPHFGAVQFPFRCG